MEPTALAYLGAGLGAGLVALGAGLGIGKLAGPAMEGSARQPEAAGDIRTSMIIAAQLLSRVFCALRPGYLHYPRNQVRNRRPSGGRMFIGLLPG